MDQRFWKRIHFSLELVSTVLKTSFQLYILNDHLLSYSCFAFSGLLNEGPSRRNSQRVRARGSGFTKETSTETSRPLVASVGAWNVSRLSLHNFKVVWNESGHYLRVSGTCMFRWGFRRRKSPVWQWYWLVSVTCTMQEVCMWAISTSFSRYSSAIIVMVTYPPEISKENLSELLIFCLLSAEVYLCEFETVRVIQLASVQVIKWF